MPHFEHVYETAGADLAVIAIDVGFNDSIDAIQAYRKKLGITMPIVFDDGSLGAAFHLRVTPTHIVIGRDGRILYVGHLADKDLDAALVAARAAPAASGPLAPAMADKSSAPIGIGDLLPNSRCGRWTDSASTSGTAPRSKDSRCWSFCRPGASPIWPPPGRRCRRIAAIMRAQWSALAGDPKVRWLGIASGLWANSADLRQYRLENHVTIPLTLDASGAVFRTFRVNDVPTVLIADAAAGSCAASTGMPLRILRLCARRSMAYEPMTSSR